jgi:hypothetical protein
VRGEVPASAKPACRLPPATFEAGRAVPTKMSNGRDPLCSKRKTRSQGDDALGTLVFLIFWSFSKMRLSLFDGILVELLRSGCPPIARLN